MSEHLLDALAHRQRHRLLQSLIERERRDGGSLAITDASEGKTAELELRHVHLPKLADADVVEWDRETGEITAGPRFDEARQLLGLAYGRREEVAGDA